MNKCMLLILLVVGKIFSASADLTEDDMKKIGNLNLLIASENPTEAKLEALENRISGKLEALENRFEGLENRFEASENRFEASENRINEKLDLLIRSNPLLPFQSSFLGAAT